MVFTKKTRVFQSINFTFLEMTITITDWKKEICNSIDSRIILDWQKTNCQTIIVNLPDELKDWKDFHVELFLKAICTGVSKKKR